MPDRSAVTAAARVCPASRSADAVRTSSPVRRRSRRPAAAYPAPGTPGCRPDNADARACAHGGRTTAAPCATRPDRRRHPGTGGCLIAGLTKMRVTSASCAASLISDSICGCHWRATTCLPSPDTRSIGCGFSNCCALQRWRGNCSQMSTSSPDWWLAWPLLKRPPAGIAMSPISTVPSAF
ncbi:Uncharacterised protein [Serratia marcescens]|uniref:Uncharacterized protein n=1 Tax=Serratia marcescens TaxID=615 RepID=A0A379Z0N0_SERMA|nr:Uncharacterised protein [Serratia marcescens]